MVFLRNWTHDCYATYLRQKSSVCAEILVPNYIPSSLISGIIVSCDESFNRVRTLVENHSLFEEVEINRDIFFI